MARLAVCGTSRTLPPQMNALALLALLMAAILDSSSAVLRRSPTYTYQSRTNLTQLWQLSLDSCAMWNAYVSGRRADAEHIFLNGNFSRDNRGRIAYKYADFATARYPGELFYDALFAHRSNPADADHTLLNEFLNGAWEALPNGVGKRVPWHMLVFDIKGKQMLHFWDRAVALAEAGMTEPLTGAPRFIDMAYTMWEGGVLIRGGSACHYETMQFVADTGLAGEMGTAYHGLSYISYGIAKAFSDGWDAARMGNATQVRAASLQVASLLLEFGLQGALKDAYVASFARACGNRSFELDTARLNVVDVTVFSADLLRLLGANQTLVDAFVAEAYSPDVSFEGMYAAVSAVIAGVTPRLNMWSFGRPNRALLRSHWHFDDCDAVVPLPMCA